MTTNTRQGDLEKRRLGEENTDREVTTRRAKLLRVALAETNRPSRRLELLGVKSEGGIRKAEVLADISGACAVVSFLCMFAAFGLGSLGFAAAFYALLAVAAAAFIAAALFGRAV